MRINLGRWFRLVCIGLAACGGALPTVQSAPTRPQVLSGTITFDTREPTPQGASERTGSAAAAFVPVRALDADGEVLESTTTDVQGAFTLNTTTAAVHLEVVTQLLEDRHDLMVTTDSGGEAPHVGRIDVASLGEGRVHFSDDTPMAGALHILQTMFRGSRAVREWTGRVLPPFFCYWNRGVTTNWSFYSGERGDTGRYTIELLGGEPGQQSTTDTDEHDEAIILHEFGHFVMDQLSSSSSHGGSHPRGVLIDPGLAWEEGRATWFAAEVLGNGWYQDTVGVEPHGELRVHHDVERGIPMDLRGLGSEAGVSEILWDLSDGGPMGSADRDGDGIALGPGGVLGAMIAMAETPGAFPNIRSFLRFCLQTARIEEDDLRHVLLLGSHPPDLVDGDASWPLPLALGASVTGKIDGVSEPAPSGGPARPTNGVDAVAVYRFSLDAPGRVELRLTIAGSGSGERREDLDLELRDIRSDLIAASRGEAPTETVSESLEAGHYIVYVRDGGRGNRVGYRLEATLVN